MPETYYNNEEGFPEEPVNGNLILCSFKEGVKVCSEAGPLFKNVTENVKNAFNLVFEVLPNFMSIGLFGLLLADYTPVFDILGYIFYPLTMLLQIPEPLLAAKAGSVYSGLSTPMISHHWRIIGALTSSQAYTRPYSRPTRARTSVSN